MAKNKKSKQKKEQWPKRAKLKEALEVFENFRDLCQFQMKLGYWATIDFPTKHHINKLLSVQYMDKEVLEKAYGKALIKRVFEIIPYCKAYIQFVRDDKDNK